MSKNDMRLGINVDHVATIRNARGGIHPNPLRAAQMAINAGADLITAHLREDRRHVSNEDIDCLSNHINVPFNLEIAPTEEMLDIALYYKPYAVCIVPEKRVELTTEGGLDVVKNFDKLSPFVQQLIQVGCRVSLFIDPDATQIAATDHLGVSVIELHTGKYCDAYSTHNKNVQNEKLCLLKESAYMAHQLGLEVHAGHGLCYDTVEEIARISEIKELHIGHFLVGESVFVGLIEVIRKIRYYMDKAMDK